MIDNSSPREFLTRRPGRKIIVMIVIGLLLFAVWSAFNGKWSYLHPFEWHSGVMVTQAELHDLDRLVLNVASCNGNPEVVQMLETDLDVRVKVSSSSFPLSGGTNDCLDQIEIQLQRPFGDRALIDKHTGQPVSVSTVNSLLDHSEVPLPLEVVSPEIGDPPSETEIQDLQRIADSKNISLQEAIDLYGWNDNFSLAVSRIREAFPTVFAGAEIVDTGHAWIAFESPPSKAALDIIAEFSNSHRGVSVEVR